MSGQSYASRTSASSRSSPAAASAPPAQYRVGANDHLRSGIGVGDVTGDGRNDVVASYGGNRPSSILAVFAQTRGGTLAAPVAYPSYDIPEPVEVADLDLDGRADVVTLHGGWNAAASTASTRRDARAEELYPIPYAQPLQPARARGRRRQRRRRARRRPRRLQQRPGRAPNRPAAANAPDAPTLTAADPARRRVSLTGARRRRTAAPRHRLQGLPRDDERRRDAARHARRR